MRGYNYTMGLSAGVFAFAHEHGRKHANGSFRVVLILCFPYRDFFLWLGLFLKVIRGLYEVHYGPMG